MQRLFSMYNLKPGVSIEAFRKYLLEVGLKIIPYQPGLKSYEVYEVKEAELGDAPHKIPYQIVEDILVESKEVMKEILSNDAMKPVVKEWSKYGDASSALEIYGEKIE